MKNTLKIAYTLIILFWTVFIVLIPFYILQEVKMVDFASWNVYISTFFMFLATRMLMGLSKVYKSAKDKGFFWYIFNNRLSISLFLGSIGISFLFKSIFLAIYAVGVFVLMFLYSCIFLYFIRAKTKK